MDFDRRFETFTRDWYTRHENEELTPEELEDKLPDLYREWLSTPDPALNGDSPQQYMAKITDADTLIALLLDAGRTGAGASMLLIDRMTEVTGCAEKIVSAINEGTVRGAFATECMNIVSELGGEHPVETYAKWLLDPSIDEGQRELSVELMTLSADTAAPFLFPLLQNADVAQKEMIAQVLSSAKPDPRTTAFLRALFYESENTPLLAALIGRYGDESLIDVLYPALDDCHYADFIEIRNAIETLGGTVDENYRDFSDDPYYKALKG